MLSALDSFFWHLCLQADDSHNSVAALFTITFIFIHGRGSFGHMGGNNIYADSSNTSGWEDTPMKRSLENFRRTAVSLLVLPTPFCAFQSTSFKSSMQSVKACSAYDEWYSSVDD